MIGNDVVDLSDPETRMENLHPRFDARVFSDAERALIGSGAGADRRRWAFWAAKEAAYKLVRRGNPATVFSPRLFHVHLDDRLRGTVDHERVHLLAAVHSHGQSIHAIVWRPGSVVIRAVARVPVLPPEALSRATRELAVRTLAGRLSLAPSSLSIEREDGVPRLRLYGSLTDVDVSLSHHGRMIAFAAAPRVGGGPGA